MQIIAYIAAAIIVAIGSIVAIPLATGLVAKWKREMNKIEKEKDKNG